MAGLTSDIEKFLKALLDNTQEGFVEIGRNDLATRFECSPSQINYVLSTRFTPYNGYLIESKRGGNGFIRIITIVEDEDDYIKYIIKNLDKELTAVVSMILAAGIDILKTAFFDINEISMESIDFSMVILFVFMLISIRKSKIDPIILMVGSGFLYLFIHLFI